MNIRQLNQFVAVARAGTISQAAKIQNISQPALTRSLQNLETDLGVRLIERRANGVFLSEYGQHLLQYAECIVGDAERVRREITAMKNGQRGQLNVGVGPAFSHQLLPRAIDELLSGGSQLELKLVEGFVEDLCDQLRIGDLDVVLSLFPSTHDVTDLGFAGLCDVESVLVCGANHPLAAHSHVGRQRLAQCNWVIADQAHAANRFREYLSRLNVPPTAHHVKASSLRLIKSLVVNSEYLSILPKILVERELASGQIRILNSPVRALVSVGGLAWRRSGYRSAALVDFIAIVEREFAQLPNLNVGTARPTQCAEAPNAANVAAFVSS